MSDATTLSFGLPRVEVQRAQQLDDGTRVLATSASKSTHSQAARPSKELTCPAIPEVMTSHADSAYGF
jgi:hypothetical protein